MRRRFRLWVLAAAAGGFLLVVAGLVHTPPVRRYVLDKAKEYLRANQGIELTATGFWYNLFTLTAGMKGLSLRSTAMPGLPPFLKIDSLSVDLDLLSILRGRPVVENARLEGTQVQIVRDEAGRDNLPAAPQQNKPSSNPNAPLGFLISHLEARRGSLRVVDQQRKAGLEFPQWTLSISGDRQEWSEDISFQEAGGNASLEGRSVPLNSLNVSSTLRPGAVEIRQLHLTAEHSEVRIAGTLKNFAEPELKFTGSANLDAGRLAAFAGLKEQLRGNLKSEVSISGPLDRLLLSTQVSGSSLSIGGFTQIELAAAASWNRGSERVRADSLSVRSPAGSVTAQANLALTKKAGESSLAAKFSSLDLERITGRSGLPVRVASRATGSAKARWRGLEFGSMAGDAQVKLASTRAEPAPDVLPVSGSLSATATGNRVNVEVVSLETMATRLEGSLSLKSFEEIGGALQAKSGSMEQLVRDLEAFLDRKPGSLAGTKLDGPLIVESRLAGTLDRPQISAALDAPATRIGELQNVILRAKGTYSRDRVVLESANTSWNGQTLTARGEIGLGGGSPRLNLNAAVQGSVAAVVAGLGRSMPLDGLFSIDATIGGTASNINAGVLVSASELKAYGEKLGTLAAQADLANRELEFKQFRLEKPEGGILTATGSYNLDSRSYTLQGEGKDIRLTSLTLPGDVPVRGEVNFSAGGSGIADNPSLTASLSLADLKVGDRLVGALNVNAQVDQHEATLEARLPRFDITAKAGLRTQSPYPAEIDIAADTDLSRLGVQIAENEPLKGNITGTIKGEGNLEEWQRGRLSAGVSDLLVTVRGQEIRNKGPLELAYEGGEIRVLSATLVAGDSRISANGSLPLDSSSPPGSLQVRSTLNMPGVLAFLPGQQDFSATGTVQLEATVRGSLQKPEPAVTLTLQGGTIAHPDLNGQVTNVDLDLQYRDGDVVIEKLAAKLGPASIKVAGEAPLGSLFGKAPAVLASKQGPAKFVLDLNDLSLSAVRSIPDTVSGTLGVHVEGETPRVDDLSALRLQAVFQPLQFKIAGYELRQTEPSRISVSGGSARIDRFLLTGPATRLEATGSADLKGRRRLNMRLSGNLDAGVFTLFTEALKAEGESRFELAFGGQISAPELSGFFETKQGQLSVPSLRVGAENLDLRVDLSPNRVRIEKLSGLLNGGDMKASGSVDYAGTQLKNFNIDVSTDGAFFNFPEGLKTQATADLKIRSQDEFVVIGGAVHVLQGSYRKDLDVGGEVLNYLQSGSQVQLPEERSPFLSRLRFNISLDTQGPLLIDDNLAKLTAEAGLRLTGDYYRPGLVGRVTLGEGGEIFFNERKYMVDRGIISFTNQAKIEPDLDILAKTQASGYDISLQLSGDPGNFSATFTSEPSLSQPDIIAVLLTGRKLEELQGSGLNVAREQVQSYLSGQIGGFLSRGAQETLGVSQFRIEPSLINPEANPGARLTLGEDVTNRLRLIYSMNLVNGGDQIYIAQYDLTKRFETEATKQSDNSYRFDFRHDLQFGGAPGAGGLKRPQQKRIGDIEFLGNPILPPEKLSEKLKVHPGDKYDFFKLQKGIDRLRDYYDRNERAEARIRVERRQKEQQVDLAVHVDAGPKVEFVFEGRSLPGGVKTHVRRIWEEGLFDAQRVQEAVQAIRRYLVGKDYLESKVDYEIKALTENDKRITFDIVPGTRYHDVSLDFKGVPSAESSRLADLLKDEDLTSDVYLDPSKVTNFLTRFYQKEGHLDASIENPQYELDSKLETGKVVIPIDKGPLFKVRRLEFHGNNGLTDSQLQEAIALSPGGVYYPESLQSSVSQIEELYWTHGYNDVAVGYRLKRAPEAGLVDAEFQITENRQAVVQKIEIEGNRRTSDNLVRTQIELAPGHILDYQKTNESRRKLYDTNAYSLVDIQANPMETATSILANNQKPVAVQVKLKEVTPFQLRYGGFYDTDRGPGGIADFSNRNSLGSARLAGIRARYDGDVHELRGYLSQPFLRRFPVDTNITGFRRRELEPSFITDRTGFSLQQEIQLRQKFVLSYGYRFERTHTFDREPDPFFPFDVTLNTAPLTVTLTRETRNDLLDATQGSFASQAFEFAPAVLGSDLRFVRYFGQYFKYLPLSRPSAIPFHKGLKRPRFVYAGAARVGLAGGLGGQELIRSERFFTGGGTTIRGFAQDTVGPVDFLGDPTGGDALLVINNEIRFPMFSIFDGVGFVDIGNVYPTAADFNPIKVRKTSGFGLRVRTPYFLLRADYGIKLDRKPGEPLGKLFFSIGQAF